MSSSSAKSERASRGDDSSRPLILYIGSRKLAAFQGMLGEGEPRVLAHAVRKNPEGFEQGLVTHLEKAVSSLQALVEEIVPARGASDVTAFAVLGNAKLKTFEFSTSQVYPAGPRTISPHEIRAVIHQTRSVAPLPLSEAILETVPESFLVNDMAGVQNPLGLTASRLGVNLKIFTMDFRDFKNLSKAFEAAEIEVKGYVPAALAASEAVLTDEEKKQGVILMDIAEELTELVLWRNSSLLATRPIALGSRSLAAQIASLWEIEPDDAERLAERYGSLELNPQFGDELIPLIERNGKGSHPIHRQAFQEALAIEARQWMARLLEEADSFAREKAVHHPRLVVTGSGTALDGFLEFLQTQFERDARLGLTHKVEAPTELLGDPSLTGVLGALRWFSDSGRSRCLLAPTGILEKTLATARDWFSTYF